MFDSQTVTVGKHNVLLVLYVLHMSLSAITASQGIFGLHTLCFNILWTVLGVFCSILITSKKSVGKCFEEFTEKKTIKLQCTPNLVF